MSLRGLAGMALMLALVGGVFWGGQQLGRMAERSDIQAANAGVVVDLSDIPTPVVANELLSRGMGFDTLFDVDPEVVIHPIDGTIPVLVEGVELVIDGVLLLDSSLIIAPAHVHRSTLTEPEVLDLIPEEDR